MSDVESIIIEAMDRGVCLDFFYNDLNRVVEPYVFGYNSTGDYLLQGYQIWGGSLRGKETGMKLFRVDNIVSPELTELIIELGKEAYDPNWVWMSEVLKQL